MTITIERDARGIPAVTASTLDDLFYGQGWATAQDRLWHLEVDRRRAAGTLAAVTGNAGHAVADAFHRRARLADRARAGFERLDAESRAMLRAHTAGVSDWAAQVSAAQWRAAQPAAMRGLDIERPAAWEPWEALAVFLVRHLTFATWQTKLWNARVFAALGPSAVPLFCHEGSVGEVDVIVPPGAREAVGALGAAGLLREPAGGDGLVALQAMGLQMSGSNGWAVHGSRTVTGLPFVAGDPHRAFEAPNVYYQVRLRCEVGGIDAAGFSFPGVPGVQHFAQTRHVAWSVTNAMADYQDLFVERLDEAVTEMRVETVEVRGGSSFTIECATTRHGPVVLGERRHGVGVALASTGLQHAEGSVGSLLALLRADTVAQVDAALRGWVEPANNWVLGDTGGEIAYRTGGRVPVRSPINSWLPVPGWTTEHDWTGFVPDAELPRVRDSAVGAIVTANQRVTGRDYAHRLGPDAAAPHRAARIWAHLGDRKGLSTDDMTAIHTDVVSIPARRWLGLLPGWDGSMRADSGDAARYGRARHNLVATIVGALPAALRDNPFREWEPPATSLPPAIRVSNALDGWIAADDHTFLPAGHPDWTSAMSAALCEATDSVGEQTWGDLHHFAPLILGTTERADFGAVNGGSDCVMATNQLGGLSTDALAGSTARYVWDLADRSRSGWVVPLGAAGTLDDPHGADQTDAWKAGRLYPVEGVPVRTEALESPTGGVRR